MAPFAVATVFLVVWLVARRNASGRAPGVAVLLVFLLGVGTVNVAAFGYQVMTEPTKVYRHRVGEEPLFVAGGLDAAVYIADHSSPNEIVATNVHCAHPPGKRCDNRSFWIGVHRAPDRRGGLGLHRRDQRHRRAALSQRLPPDP